MKHTQLDEKNIRRALKKASDPTLARLQDLATEQAARSHLIATCIEEEIDCRHWPGTMTAVA